MCGLVGCCSAIDDDDYDHVHTIDRVCCDSQWEHQQPSSRGGSLFFLPSFHNSNECLFYTLPQNIIIVVSFII